MKNINKWLAGLTVVSLILAAFVAAPAIAQNFTALAVADGARSNPTIGFVADATAGFYRAPGTGNVGVAGGIALPRITSSQTPGSQATITCAPQSFTVTGVAVNDQVILVSFPATGNGTGYGTAQVTAANTIAQTICNPTAGALTPAAGVFTYLVIKPQ